MNARCTLITGATGFAGSHLAEHCVVQGARVIGISRSSHSEPNYEKRSLPLKLSQLDLTKERDRLDELLVRLQPDFLFHLAAQASVAESWQDPEGTRSENLTSTENVLESVRGNSPKTRVLVACSGEEYGAVDAEDLPVTERHPLRPQNPYALSKAEIDLMCGFYADAYGMHVTRTRAFNHFGPRQSNSYVVASFARQIAEAEAQGNRATVRIITGNTAVKRDFTDVRDVVSAYWLALEKAEPGVYNVCSGRAVAIADLLDQLARLTSLEVENEADPALLRDNEVMENRASCERLRAATGWQPRFALEQTLTDTLDWWRQNLREEAGK